jgi:hypothetical protein
MAESGTHNIGHIRGLECAVAGTAFVIELVDGSRLADRIRTGPLPLDEAHDIARWSRIDHGARACRIGTCRLVPTGL